MDDSDIARVATWLGSPLSIDGRANGGSSNVTWFVRVGPRLAVLRHPPRDAELLSTAHDVLREARVLRALADHHGDAPIPVPEVLAMCADESVLGVPFVIIGRRPGVCLLTATLADLDPVALAHGAIDTLSSIHRVDVERLALDSPARSYLARQIDRWDRQLRQTTTAARLGDLAPIVAWLHRERPADEARALVHGDYGFHNLLVSTDRIEAVLDWELATVGDPIADLFSFLKSWGAGATASNAANDAVARRFGSPTRDDLLARYERRSGRDVRAHARFYDAFGLWRSIGILEGIHARSGGSRFRDETPRLVTAITAMMTAVPDTR